MRNIACCKKCWEVIESFTRHDFVTCDCGAISVDGGNDYCKRSGNPSDFDKLPAHLPPIRCKCGHSWENHHHGIIMNPSYPPEDHKNGSCRGVKAQECEATQTNGEWHSDDESQHCYCQNYEPLRKE